MADEKTIKRGRVYDHQHIQLIKKLPCISCWHAAPSEAAHIRMADHGYGIKEAGMACKPSDCMTLPLCDQCHRTGHHAEHNVGGSRIFYQKLGIDPIKLAFKLYELGASGGLQAMAAHLLKVRVFGQEK